MLQNGFWILGQGAGRGGTLDIGLENQGLQTYLLAARRGPKGVSKAHQQVRALRV